MPDRFSDFYDRCLREANRGTWVAFLPSLDDDGPMLYRVLVEKDQLSNVEMWADDDDRAYAAARRMIRVRREQGYPIPTNEDYARGRN